MRRKHLVDVFVLQLNFRRTIRLLESPARQALPGTAAHLAEKSYLAGKATTFSTGIPAGDFNSLKLRRKELHCEREGNSQMV